MAAGKQNLSDLLRQEVKQDSTKKSDSTIEQTTSTQPSASALSRMTKAQLLEHIKTLESNQTKETSEVKPDPEAEKIAAQNEVLAQQVKELEGKIATQNEAIATADKTIQTLKSDSTAKTKLEQELTAQKGLVEKLYAQVQELEAEAEAAQPEPEPAPIQRTVDEDRALVLARISSYQANLQFPGQPSPSIPEEDIGWFD